MIESLAADYRRMGLIDSGDTSVAELAAEMISALTIGTILTYLDHPAAERARLRARLLDGLVQFTLGGVPGLVADVHATRRRPRRTTRSKKGAL